MSATSAALAKRAVRIYTWLLVILFALALLVVGIQTMRGLGYPANTFLFDPDYRFSDFAVFASRFRSTASAKEFFEKFGDTFNYGAPAFVAFSFLSKAMASPWYLMLGVVAVTAATAALWLARSLQGSGFFWAIPATLLLNYPLLYTMDRGNFEGMIWPVMLLSILLFARKKYYWAAGCFGLIAATKFFPAILFLLLVRKQRWKELIFGILTFAGSTYGSLCWIGPNPLAAQQHISNAMASFKEWYTLYWDYKEIGFDHSLFAVWKQILRQWFGNTDDVPDVLTKTVNAYAALTGGGFLLLYWFRLRKLPVLNCVMACLVAMVTFPYVSYDYTLSHLYIAWGLFLIFLARGAACLTLRQMLLFLVPFAVIFTPQSYLLWEDFGFGGQVKAVALLCLFLCALRFPLPLPQLDEGY